MADEENKKSFGDTLLDVGAAVGKTAVDELGHDVPIVGPMLQAAFNTPGYQDRQRARESAQMQYDLLKSRKEEWEKDAPVREAQRQADLQKSQEYLAGAEDRKKARDVAALQTDNAYAAAIEQRKNAFLKQAYDANYQLLESSGLGGKEIDGYMNSPAYKADALLKFGVTLLDEFGRTKDPRLWDILSRFGSNRGWEVMDGENGKKILIGMDSAGTKRVYEATPDGVKQAMENMAANAGQELQTRRKYSVHNAMGNPVLSGGRDFISKASAYTNGNWSSAERIYNQISQEAAPEEKKWRVVNQAIRDYRSNAPTQARLAGLQCLAMPTEEKMNGVNVLKPALLEQLGIAIDENSPGLKDGNVNNITFQMQDEAGNWNKLSFEDVAKIAEQNDSLGSRLDDRLARMKESVLIQDKNYFVQAAKAVKQIAAKKPQEKNAEAPQGVTEEQYNSMLKLFGDDMLEVQPEQQMKLLDMMKKIRQIAKAEGVLVQDNIGQWRISPNADAQTINRFAGIEDKQLKNLGLKNLVGKGYFSRIRDVQKQTSELKNAKEKETLVENMWNSSLPQKEDSGKGILARAFENMGGHAMRESAANIALAQKFSGKSSGNTEEKLKKTKQHLSK